MQISRRRPGIAVTTTAGQLLAGTLLTLIFLPALYVAVYGARTAAEPGMVAAPTA